MSYSQHRIGFKLKKVKRRTLSDEQIEVIRNLRDLDWSYEQIAKCVQINVGTVWDVVNPEAKKARHAKQDQTVERRIRRNVAGANRREREGNDNPHHFRRSPFEMWGHIIPDPKARIKRKVLNTVHASNKRNGKHGMLNWREIYEDVMANPVCYLSGYEIDLDKDNWQMDHVIPMARGGENVRANYKLCLQAYNAMKGDLLIPELICSTGRFLEHQGYEIIGHEDRDIHAEIADLEARLAVLKAKRDRKDLTTHVSSAYVANL